MKDPEREGRARWTTLAATLCLALTAACKTAQPASPDRPALVVQRWGGMREVLRDGRTEGRVALADVLGENTVAVGVMAGLAGEITVLAGEVYVAAVEDPASPTSIRLYAPEVGGQATLLVLADVETWAEMELPPVRDLAALEDAVRVQALADGIDTTQPFPFRVGGVARSLHLHVLNHSCPIADPDGPPPWTFDGTDVPVELVGFYAEGFAGELTHHGQSSHVHALLRARGVAGHLDAVTFDAGARLFLPVLAPAPVARGDDEP